jgi:very-short-patch-repair endonuclease
MRPEIDDFLATRGGVATRDELLQLLTRSQLDHEIARGHLVAPFPRAYCRPWDADHSPVRERAALASVGQPAALSHLTALRRWGLTVPPAAQVHVTVPISRHPIGRVPSLVVHRTRVPTLTRTLDGLRTIDPAVAVVRSWPLTVGPDQPAPAIEAVRNRLVAPTELASAADRAIGMRGRAQLLRLATLLDAGCESELEIWGYLGVFNVPGLDHAVRQKVVRVNGREYRLDLAYEEERVAVELDGERYHSSRDQRERDRRRDAALATIDWLTLRYSHERLHGDVHGCRQDTLATLGVRRGRARKIA